MRVLFKHGKGIARNKGGSKTDGYLARPLEEAIGKGRSKREEGRQGLDCAEAGLSKET